jgi:predicted CXXCH cytochrome family protein
VTAGCAAGNVNCRAAAQPERHSNVTTTSRTFAVLARCLGRLALGLAILSLPAFAQLLPSPPHGPSVGWRSTAVGNPADYVGTQRCISCHKREVQQYLKTVHATAAVPGAKYATGCEACHGPGKAHSVEEEAAEGDDAKIAAANKLIYNFETGKPAANAERCLDCHRSSRDQHLFDRSEHLAVGVSCDRCHAAHLLKASYYPDHVSLRNPQGLMFDLPALPEENRWLHTSLLKAQQPELCFGCHATVQTQFALPNHHRVPEGYMKCTDCHSPHGTINQASLRRAGWETCYSCHPEKRGPFVYEHASVKIEGCADCHNPHGVPTACCWSAVNQGSCVCSAM